MPFMSEVKFNPKDNAIILNTELKEKIVLHTRMLLDTGASLLILPWRIATGLGLDIDPSRLISITTASAVESAPLTNIQKVTVLGKTVKNVPCLIKDLPPESGVDGLLGLSFLRHFKTTIDFKRGILTIE